MKNLIDGIPRPARNDFFRCFIKIRRDVKDAVPYIVTLNYVVGVGFLHDPILHLTTANAEPPLEGKPLFDKTSKKLVGRGFTPAEKILQQIPLPSSNDDTFPKGDGTVTTAGKLFGKMFYKAFGFVSPQD